MQVSPEYLAFPWAGTGLPSLRTLGIWEGVLCGGATLHTPRLEHLWLHPLDGSHASPGVTTTDAKGPLLWTLPLFSFRLRAPRGSVFNQEGTQTIERHSSLLGPSFHALGNGRASKARSCLWGSGQGRTRLPLPPHCLDANTVPSHSQRSGFGFVPILPVLGTRSASRALRLSSEAGIPGVPLLTLNPFQGLCSF